MSSHGASMTAQEWQGTGDINRDGAWGFFIIMNFLAIAFNSSLVYSIWRLKKKKTSTEVLIGGLASGIIIGAFGCGPQCFINVISGTFAYGSHGACFTEAFLHLVGMEIQFVCVAAIAHRTYIGVVKLKPYPVDRAIMTVICAWVFAPCATILSGNYSHYYLVASGTFCFYEWASPALIFVAWPLAIVSVGLTGYWYFHTFKAFALARQATDNNIHTESGMGRDLAIRLSSLVILFFFGYIGIISQSMYELFIGRAKAWGDIVAAVIVLIFWVSAPFAYAHANRRLGIESVLICLPKRARQEVRQWNDADVSEKRSHHANSSIGSEEKKFTIEIHQEERSRATTTDQIEKSPGLEASLTNQLETPEDMSPTHRDGGNNSPYFSSEKSRSTPRDESSPAVELTAKPLFNPFSYQPVSLSSPSASPILSTKTLSNIPSPSMNTSLSRGSFRESADSPSIETIESA